MKKRIFDLIFCLILCMPFLIVISVISIFYLLRFDFPFFFQDRIGQGGKNFKIIKFRTMKKNADEILSELLASDSDLKSEWEANYKLKNDPRITVVGSFLRKTSLDETPQFLNVFMGQMSWVGPRPIVEEELRKYGVNKGVYLQQKPGLTGLWQVSVRNNESYDERVKLDLRYSSTQSIFLDIKIIVMTLLVVFKGTGQ